MSADAPLPAGEAYPEIPSALRAILACPKCRGTLQDVREGAQLRALRCTHCKLQYPVVAGLPVLLIDRAEAVTV